MTDNSDSQFIAYVGPPSLHDGRITRVECAGDTVVVGIQSYEGDDFAIEFNGVTKVEAVAPEGMILYALCEMSDLFPQRRFICVNTDEGEDGVIAKMEVWAQDFQDL